MCPPLRYRHMRMPYGFSALTLGAVPLEYTALAAMLYLMNHAPYNTDQ